MTPAFGWLIVWQGALMAGCTLAAFWVVWRGRRGTGARGHNRLHGACDGADVARLQHALPYPIGPDIAAFHQWLAVGATAICIALQVAAVQLPFLRDVLGTVPLSLSDWRVVAVASLVPVAVAELIQRPPRQAT